MARDDPCDKWRLGQSYKNNNGLMLKNFLHQQFMAVCNKQERSSQAGISSVVKMFESKAGCTNMKESLSFAQIIFQISVAGLGVLNKDPTVWLEQAR